MNKRPLLLAGFFFAVLCIYAFRLGEPAIQYYDEVYYVKAAHEILNHSRVSETSHPPLVKFLMAMVMHLFGDEPWCWRLLSLTTGVACIVAFFYLAEIVLKSWRPALGAAFLFAIDGILITQSRIAMLNTMMLFFMLMSLLYFFKFLKHKQQGFANCLLCGFFLGGAVGARWIGLSIVLVIGLAALTDEEPRQWSCYLRAGAVILASSCLAYFCLQLLLLLIPGYTLQSIWNYQLSMLRYHSHLKASHTYSSAWWTWPLMIRPIWYFFERSRGMVRGVLCIGNPAVLWAFIPASGFLVLDSFKSSSRMSRFVLAGYMSQWLPFSLIGRVQFFHYYMTAMPFVVLGLTLFLKEIWRAGQSGRIFVSGYLLASLCMFFYWFPVWTAWPISEGFFRHHLWFKSWI